MYLCYQSFKSTKRTSSGNSGANNAPGKSFATEPPKKIIQALYDYRPQGPGELKFSKGDFLYVTGNENNDDWYEAYDPPSNMRGMVPVSYFEIVSRKDTIQTVPIHSAAALAATSTAKNPTLSTSSSKHFSDTSTFSTNNRSTVGSSSTSATNTSSTRHSNASATSSAGNTNVINSSSFSSASSSTITTLNNNNSSTAPSNSNTNNSSAAANNARLSRKAAGHSQLYGIVLYDFKAERSDELSAAAGESIIIIAKSNDEWFVAKPIGRLGGPGLIPISFIEVRNIGSNQPVANLEQAIIDANVPRVEEWKRMAAEYKASSIPLGKLEEANPLSSRLRNLRLSNASQHQAHAFELYQLQQQQQIQNQPYPQQQIQNQPYPQQQSHINSSYSASSSSSSFQSQTPQIQQTTPIPSQQTPPQKYAVNENEPYVISACVDRYAFSDDRYWYLVVAELSTGKYRHLCRYYQDFYDFQINLLDEFPDEAGRTGKERTLPFMPGPLTYVNDSISSQRRVNLDEYVRNLVNLPVYISRSPIVQQLFAIRTGDVESASPNSVMPQPPNRIHTKMPDVHEQPPPASSPTYNINNGVSNGVMANISDISTPTTATTTTPNTITASDGHMVAPDTYPQRSSIVSTDSNNRSQQMDFSGGQSTQLYPDIDTSRGPSFIAPDDAFNPKHSVYLEEGRPPAGEDGVILRSNNNSQISTANQEIQPKLQNNSQYNNSTNNNEYELSAGEGMDREANFSSSDHMDTSNVNTEVYHSATSLVDPSNLEESKQLRGPTNSGDHATFTESQEQLHQAKPQGYSSFQEVYVKIKVFHEDDLIAIRVSNAIPFEQLSEKIAERLNLSPETIVLLYKNEYSGEMVELRSSEDFLEALGTKVKLVLCAR